MDRTYYLAEGAADLAYDAGVKNARADVVDAIAAAAHAASPSQIGHDGGALLDRLDILRHRRDELAGLLLVDPHIDPAAWQQHGALLAAIDRLRVEIAAAGRPVEPAWQPTRLHQPFGSAPDDRQTRRARRS